MAKRDVGDRVFCVLRTVCIFEWSRAGFGGGSGRLPSLHVKVFALYCLWAPAVGRWWLAWNLVVGTVILLGSRLTGYHYLVDGPMEILMAALPWVIGRQTLRRGAEEGCQQPPTASTAPCSTSSSRSTDR